MKRPNLLPLAIMAAIFHMTMTCASDSKPLYMKKGEFNYPITEKLDTNDVFFGESVPNPYKWLEDDRSEATEVWVDRQNTFTYGYIDRIKQRAAIADRLQELWAYERYGNPIKKGDYYYFLKNDGLQNQDILYRQKGEDGDIEEVLNPNTFSSDGTASLGAFNFSLDGKYLAYQKSVDGSDWHDILILNLDTGKELAEKISWVKFSEVSWTKDGFYYARFPEPKKGAEGTVKAANQSVYFHKIGTNPKDDELVFLDRAHPDRGFIIHTTEEDQYQILQTWESTSGNALSIRVKEEEKEGFIPVIHDFDFDFTYLGSKEDQLLFLTNAESPNKKIISLKADNLKRPTFNTVLEEGKSVIDFAHIYGNSLVVSYIEDASSKMKVFDLEGKLKHEIKLPSIGTVKSVSGSKSDDKAFFSFTSFTQPVSIYRLDLETGQVTPYKSPQVPFDSDKYVTKQVWYNSKDGTRIPMFISHKKGLKLDGQRPTMLYGYGGFDISILPSFNTSRLLMAPIMMENDGIFVVANIRGGGEFGSAWHKAGTKQKKQNVFDDFIAAGEYLIDKGYTSSDRLAAYGRSNGGLLIGACVTQRPDLFGVALPAVGVLDMLHYEEFTIGWAWASDYGSVKDKQAYQYLKNYSPVHNATPQNYPPTLITTADHDDRVVPAHSFKFAAALQEAQTGEAPIMIRIGKSAGHGDGKSTSEKISEAADILAFTFYNFGLNIDKAQ